MTHDSFNPQGIGQKVGAYIKKSNIDPWSNASFKGWVPKKMISKILK